ncbi:hypothetical protein Tco_1524165 [Tanacetum coccineum]
MKRSSSSTSTSRNLAFLSSENTSSTNEVSTASGDFRIDEDDLEELDLRWQVAMLTVRVRKFIQKTGRNMISKKNDLSNAPTNESSSQALVAQDGLGGYDWNHNLWDVIVNGDLEEEPAQTRETSTPLAPKTAKQLAAKRNQERVAVKSRFGGNEESKKIQKNVLKHQFENFTTASNESLDKAYDRVYEDEMKRSLSSTSTSQNLAFLSSENTSSTNEVSTASGDFGVSTAGGISQVSTTPCAHDVACSFFAQPTTSPQLENEDFQQIDEDDLEELDLRWQVAMLTVRVKKFIQKTGRNLDFKEKRPVSLDKSKINYDWSNDFEVEPVNYALMAISSSSSSSSSDNEGYELALESLESRILVHEKNELAWGKKYEFQNYKLKCREIKINNFNLELEKVVKERDELKIKIEKWEESSKNLDELLNSQMNARYKTSLGYGIQLNEMSNNSKTDSKISLSVFDVRLSDEENTPANDRFSKADGFHVVPPPITGNFLTTRSHISFASLDEYAIRKKIIKDKVIIEDWNSDDEDDVSEVQNRHIRDIVHRIIAVRDELKFNLFSVSQMCDKKNSVLFTETKCLILSPSFKLLDKSQVVLRAPRKDDVYSFLWRSAEGSMQQHDLTVLVNILNDRIDGLEKDLQQIKKTYSTALTKLVLRVKKLEYKLKSGNARRKAKIILFDDEEIAEDSSK